MALNKCIIQGNLCKDIELLTTNNGGTYLRNTIACQRNYSRENEEKQSDFINIVTYGKTAEFISKYFQKGSQILIEGRIQTGSYEKQDGTKVYTTDIVVERVFFCGTKKQENNFETEMENKNVTLNVVEDSDQLPF